MPSFVSTCQLFLLHIGAPFYRYTSLYMGLLHLYTWFCSVLWLGAIILLRLRCYAYGRGIHTILPWSNGRLSPGDCRLNRFHNNRGTEVTAELPPLLLPPSSLSGWYCLNRLFGNARYESGEETNNKSGQSVTSSPVKHKKMSVTDKRIQITRLLILSPFFHFVFVSTKLGQDHKDSWHNS